MKKTIRVSSLLWPEWQEMTIEDLAKETRDHPTTTFEVKCVCKHHEQVVYDGEKRCKKCNDLIEITSYRD